MIRKRLPPIFVFISSFISFFHSLLFFSLFFSSQWLHPEEISPLFLWFKNKSWEGPYCSEDDLLYKFYIMASFVLLNAMGIILLLTEKQ